MTDRVFVDSNILVYAHDLDSGPKQQCAADRLRELWDTHAGRLRRRADITCSVDQTRLHRGETEERRSARRKTERTKRKRSCVNRRA